MRKVVEQLRAYSIAAALIMISGAAYANSITLAFITTNEQNPAEVGMAKGFKQAGEAEGAKVRILDAKGSVENMANAVQDMIAQQVSGIAVIPLDGVVAQSWVNKADAAHIPFVSIAVEIGDPNKRPFKDVYPGLAAFVGQDYVDTGDRMAQAAAKLLPKGHTAQIGIIEGQPGYALVTQLTQGFEQGLKDAGVKYDIVTSQPTDWTPAMGEQVCQNALVADPNIDLFFSQAEDMAIGCAKAIASSGSHAKLVTVAGGSRLGHPLIMSGAIAVSMCEPWVEVGALGATALYKAAADPSTPRAQLIQYKPKLIDKSNASAVCPYEW